ncbi:hypothetical protein [Streptomyces sp. 8N706]|uniref:hypothetical protein n=1 Tax=Streptomyces sp. 8N706 TaxID=3457416 RepID=UPI003FD23FF2
MRPGADLYTGALIRRALTEQGVSHRVGAGATERGWLATTGHDGPTLYITAHDCNGRMGYDVDRAAFIGFNAVVTDEQGTRMVYNGTAEDRRPAVDAEECTRAVAAFLRLRPFCGWCEDTGSITSITLRRTGSPVTASATTRRVWHGVSGWRPSTKPARRGRRRKRRHTRARGRCAAPRSRHHSPRHSRFPGPIESGRGAHRAHVSRDGPRPRHESALPSTQPGLCPGWVRHSRTAPAAIDPSMTQNEAQQFGTPAFERSPAAA